MVNAYFTVFFRLFLEWNNQNKRIFSANTKTTKLALKLKEEEVVEEVVEDNVEWSLKNLQVAVTEKGVMRAIEGGKKWRLCLFLR